MGHRNHRAELRLLKVFCFTFINLLLSVPQPGWSQSSDMEVTELLALSLDELMNMEVDSTAALTKTSRRKSPAAVITLTQEEIRRSGARSLDELLTISIPNLMLHWHGIEYQHLGLRGINSDREDKWLLLVNGRVMNEHSHYGVLSERDLPMLSDIHHVDVVRGPGSALYGPGALAMVVNIVTDNARTFTGSEVTTRAGAVQEYYTGEFKTGHALSENSGLFLFAGAGKNVGASPDDAQHVYLSRPRRDGPTSPTTIHYDDDHVGGHQGFRNGRPKLKLHGHYYRGDFDVWARYTRGGAHFTNTENSNVTNRIKGMGYQQATGHASYQRELGPTVSVMTALSYDVIDMEQMHGTQQPHGWREEEYYGKLMARWTPDTVHSLAGGVEGSHERFNLEPWGWPDQASRWILPGETEPTPWHSNLLSLVLEYQRRWCDWFTLFAGGRVDKHTFTPYMYSPRIAGVFTPNDRDTIKLIASRSVKSNHAYEMWKNDAVNGKESDVERLHAYEWRYERQQSQALRLAGTVYFHDHDLLGWGGSGIIPLGTFRSIGGELEALYRCEKLHIQASHGYTTLLDADWNAAVSNQIVSPEYYGGLTAFANWDDHISKLRVAYDISERTKLDSTLRMYWGSRGRDNFEILKHNGTITNSRGDRHYPGDPVYDGGYFLSLGLEHCIREHLTLRVDAHDVLGWIDKDINARPYLVHYRQGAAYDTDAPSISLFLRYLHK